MKDPEHYARMGNFFNLLGLLFVPVGLVLPVVNLPAMLGFMFCMLITSIYMIFYDRALRFRRERRDAEEAEKIKQETLARLRT